MLKVALLVAIVASAQAATYFNEYKVMPGHKNKNSFSLPTPSSYIADKDLPDAFTWGNVNGTNYLTKSLNQHIPQYCGSCWAHGALSALGDRIKIARKAAPNDVDLAIQYILNCGGEVAGSCHGGSHTGTYEFIKQRGYVPYDTCLQYSACSSESQEGFCPSANWDCSAMNTCRTCSTFSDMGGKCVGLDTFPNATIAEYGEVQGATDMMKEIFARGPIACGVNAEPLHDYNGGIYTDKSASTMINHIISVVGWGQDKQSGNKFWIVRNSWGEFWGEMGYFRIEMGSDLLGIEDNCAWATPQTWSEHNFPCYEDGSNCVARGEYVDPSVQAPWHLIQ